MINLLTPSLLLSQHTLSFFDAFRTFSVWDAIDILFLTAILFFLFRFLSNKKTIAILVGICFCVISLILSQLLHLDAVHYVFSGLFRVGALALIIIFQPELRAALERLGTGSIGTIKNIRDRNRRRRMYSIAIEHICAAVDELARSKTGALIVVERTTRLDDVTETGVVINADVNSYLIRNLFFNKAPLHDGAVVIQDAKIVAAGCLLPLTRRGDVDSELGTRHRAAIGLSEVSDAVIVVVSEETGRISVAFDCSLVRDFTPETLKLYLNKKICNANSETSAK